MKIYRSSVYRYRLDNIAYYIFWTLLLIGKGLGMTSAYPAMVTITWVAIAFVCVKLFLTKWNKKEFIILCSLLILGMIVFLKTRDAALLLSVLAICAAKGIDLKRLFKYSFWLKATMFVVRTTMALVGFIDKQVLVRYDSGDIHTVRYALGYGQPNATHYTLFVIYVLLFLSYRKLKTWHFILLEAYNYFIFTYTDSRAGFLYTSLLVLCIWAIKSRVISNIFNKIGKLLCYSYIILSVISLTIPYFINFLMRFTMLGTALSRFKTGAAVLASNSLSLFGAGNITTDFGYIFICYQYGFIALVFFVIANTLLMKLFFEKKMFTEFFIILTYAVYTLMESYSASILMNTSLILISIFLYKINKDLYFGENTGWLKV